MSSYKTNSNKRSLKRIPLRYETFDEIRELVKFLKEKGYKILHGLDNLKEGSHVVAVIIDDEDKTLSTTNITCMARWCSWGKKPLSIKEFFKFYDILIIRKDIEFYYFLIQSNAEGVNDMPRKKELVHRIYDLLELIETKEKQEYIDELAEVINEFVPLVSNLDLVNTVWWSMCSIITIVDRHKKLQEAVMGLKQKQLSLMKLC